MTCEKLRVPYSSAKSVEDLTEADRYVAYVIAEAESLYRQAQEKRR